MLDEFQAAADTTGLGQDVGAVMGPVKILIWIIAQSGVFEHFAFNEVWLMAAIANVITMTWLIRKFTRWDNAWLLIPDVLWSFVNGLAYLKDGVVDFLVASILLAGTTAISLKAIGWLGSRARYSVKAVTGVEVRPRGEFNRGPSKNEGT